MIKLERHGTEIRINAICSKNNYTYYFSYQCGQGREDYAILLCDALKDSLYNAIKAARSEAYDRGYKDAKKKTRKQDWFSGGLN